VQGRIDPTKWIDWNFFGSQVVTHFASSDYVPKTDIINGLPIPSYGVYVT